MYFCPIMNSFKRRFNHLSLCAFFFFSAIVSAQDAQTQINAPEKLKELLSQKIELDRNAAMERQFTIQVHYGNHETITGVMETFKELFPDIEARMIFETPNYKIRAGRFATEQEAMTVLPKIKRKFKAAFVLKP